MRVLQLCAGNLFGGIEVNLLTLARFRDVCPEVEADYGVCFEAKLAESLRRVGGRVHELGQVRFSRPWTVMAARRRLSCLLRENHYDVVICQEEWTHAAFAPVILNAGSKLVFWAHDRHERPGDWLARLARRTPPDLVICNSRYTADSMSAYLPGVAFEVVYCPVAPLPKPADGVRADYRRRLQTPDESVVIVQVGRWEPHKGHLVHMEALGLIRDTPNWVCWQVGAPQRKSEKLYQDEVRRAAAAHGVGDRVHFLGWQPELGTVLAAADVYCQPNVRPEPFGISIVEALYARLPVIASDQAGPREILTQSCGFLGSPGDAHEIATALSRLIRLPDLRRTLGAAGPDRAAELCDPARQVVRFTKALANLMTPG